MYKSQHEAYIRQLKLIQSDVEGILKRLKENCFTTAEILKYRSELLLKRDKATSIHSVIICYASNNTKHTHNHDYGSILTSIQRGLDVIDRMKWKPDLSDHNLQIEMHLEDKKQLQNQISNLQEKLRLNEESSRALICQFRRDINKLRLSLLQEEIKPPTVCTLESNKKSWQEQLDAIKELYKKMGSETSINEDIREEYKLIEREFDYVIQATTKQIQIMEIETIKIPHFNGDTSKWNTFHYLFKKFVHDNIRIPKVEKLLQLKCLLQGESLKLIDHLPNTDNSYESAWDIIVQKFGDKNILLRNLIDKIMDQPNICSKSVEDVKSLLDTTTESMQTLSLSGINMDDLDPIIARIIIRKLDEQGLMHYELSSKEAKGMQLLDDLLQFLEQQHRALEADQISKPAEEAAQTPQLAKDTNNVESQKLNNLSLATESSKINVEKCLPTNISSSGSSKREVTEKLNDTSDVRNLCAQEFDPIDF